MYQRPNGTWCDTLPNGKGKTKFFYGKTKAEVKRKMSEWQNTKDRGKLFNEIADDWIESRRTKLRLSTFKGYYDLVQKIEPSFKDIYCSEITTLQLQNYMSKLIEQGYSNLVVRRYLTVVKLVLEYYICQPDCVIQYNPANGVKFPKEKKHIRELPSDEIIQAVKDNVDKPFGLFAYLILYSGLRRGEALALTDKDFSNGYITVNKSLCFNSNLPYISLTKTESGIRKVKILSPLEKKLPSFSGYLFSANDDGKEPLNFSMFNRRWTDYCREAGLNHTVGKLGKAYGEKRDLCPHQLRHAFATMCYDAGLDSKDTMELLGHANESTTREVYIHIDAQRRKQSLDKLESFVSTAY